MVQSETEKRLAKVRLHEVIFGSLAAFGLGGVALFGIAGHWIAAVGFVIATALLCWKLLGLSDEEESLKAKIEARMAREPTARGELWSGK